MENQKVKKLRFKTKCGVEFDSLLTPEDNWQGYILIGKSPAYPNTDSELVKSFNAEGISNRCAECALEKEWKEEFKHLCKRDDPNIKLDTIMTFCIADITSMPYPNVCPVTGDPFERFAVDYDFYMGDGEIVPLYKDSKGNLHTNLWLEVDGDELRYMYKVVKEIDDDGCIDFGIGTYIYDKTKESIVNDLKFLSDGLKDMPLFHEKAEHLYNVFSALNFNENEDEDDEDDEDDELEDEDEECLN